MLHEMEFFCMIFCFDMSKEFDSEKTEVYQKAENARYTL